MPRALALLCLATLTAPAALAEPWPDGAPNRPGIAPAFAEQARAPAERSDPAPMLDLVAEGLDAPWGLAVLPGDAGYLATERGGTLRHVARDGTVSGPISGVPEVVAMRQGGLLDIALAPDFADSRRLYLTLAAPAGLGRSATAAVRAELSADMSALTGVTEIFRQDPPAMMPGHFGSRVTPLPDGTLALTTGDRMRHTDRAQDPATGYGAVIRVTPEGAAPADNPFLDVPGTLPTLYSYGHRNLQGAAVDPATGRLWTLEHGPAGGDEFDSQVIGRACQIGRKELAGGQLSGVKLQRPRDRRGPRGPCAPISCRPATLGLVFDGDRTGGNDRSYERRAECYTSNGQERYLAGRADRAAGCGAGLRRLRATWHTRERWDEGRGPGARRGGSTIAVLFMHLTRRHAPVLMRLSA